jgi:hypothetical protein
VDKEGRKGDESNDESTLIDLAGEISELHLELRVKVVLLHLSGEVAKV